MRRTPLPSFSRISYFRNTRLSMSSLMLSSLSLGPRGPERWAALLVAEASQADTLRLDKFETALLET